MSLTSFLSQPHFREKFKQEFPKPSLKIKKEILAPPLTEDNPLIGTAFDYLLRFQLKQLNPQAWSGNWVAERAIELMVRGKGEDVYQKGNQIISKIKKPYLEFLETGEITDKLIESALSLSKLDFFYRTRKFDKTQTDSRHVQDLRGLIEQFNPDIFPSDGKISLNPEFGLGSVIVGGADADLVIGDLLIDVKTISTLELKRDDFNQLIGYYTLSKIDQIDGTDPQQEIKRIGIYFSRYAYLHVIEVDQVIDPAKFPAFLEWFRGQFN
ncbi:hypothetical protein NDI33_13725 [Trichocoleus sp. DQ-A1]